MIAAVFNLPGFTVAFFAAILLSSQAYASGLLKPQGSQYQDLEIREHHVDVVIEDGYATTTIDQVFFNPNSDELEALYSFPVPKHAVVGEFIYWINDQPVIAEAVEKTKAKQIYNDQKAQGNATALTEKDSYKTFEMQVFPIQPNQTVKVRLVYMQDALLDHGIGRYVYPMEEGGVDELKAAFWQRNDAVEDRFTFTMTLRSSYPIDGVRLPKHPQAQVQQSGNGVWVSSFSNSAQKAAADEEGATEGSYQTPTQQIAFRLDQDIVIYWRHTEGLPGRVDLVSYRDPKQSNKGTFKLTLTPGDDLPAIRQERNWVFVLDKSGSMSGKYNTLVEGVRQGLSQLPASDMFRVVTFNNHAEDITHGYQPVADENIQRILAKIEQDGVKGGTNLYRGLEEAVSELDADRPTGIVLITDGVANVGVTEKESFLKLLSKYDVRLFTFIMGNSANEPLLEQMTKVSNGFAQNISNSDDIIGHLLNATSKINHQALRDIELKINGVKVKDVTPDSINSLYRGEQLNVFGHYFKAGESQISLTARIGSETKTYQTRVIFPETATSNPELERMWAFSAIRDLEQQMIYLGEKDADVEQAMQDIAIEYGLLTDHTSLLVVEEELFKQLGIDRNNKQRVEREQHARQLRKQSQPAERTTTEASTRADEAQPMFTSPAPTHNNNSGGGSIGFGGLLLLMAMMGLRWRSQS
ncbi:VIT and VWA domain-containing protein [Photobacterium sagamiensis]